MKQCQQNHFITSETYHLGMVGKTHQTVTVGKTQKSDDLFIYSPFTIGDMVLPRQTEFVHRNGRGPVPCSKQQIDTGMRTTPLMLGNMFGYRVLGINFTVFHNNRLEMDQSRR